MKNHRVFEVYYLPQTETKPSRFKINDLRHRKSIIVSRKYDETYDFDAKQLGEHILNKLGINLIGFGEAKRGFVLFSDNFSIPIK